MVEGKKKRQGRSFTDEFKAEVVRRSSLAANRPGRSPGIST
jgi:transposase-like protein